MENKEDKELLEKTIAVERLKAVPFLKMHPVIRRNSWSVCGIWDGRWRLTQTTRDVKDCCRNSVR